MKPAILSLLWAWKAPAVIDAYLARGPRVLLTYADYVTPVLQEVVVRRESEIVFLDSLLVGERQSEFQREGVARAAQVRATFEANPRLFGWGDDGTRETVAPLGSISLGESFDPRPLLLQNLETRLAQTLQFLATLDLARIRYAIELLVHNEDLMRYGKAAVRWAQAHGIPTLHVSHSLITGLPYHVNGLTHSDRIAIFGDRARDGYADIGVDPARLITTGNPAWDLYPALISRREELRAQLRQQYGLDDLPILLFGTTWSANLSLFFHPAAYTRTLSDFLRACKLLTDKGIPFRAVIKDRPSNADFGHARFEALRDQWGLNPANCLYVTADTEIWVTAAHALVSVDSNLSLEAALAGTPAVNLRSLEQWQHSPIFDAEDGILQAAADELSMVCESFLTDAAFAAAVVAAQSVRISSYNGPNDGQAAQRLAELMAQMAEPQLTAPAESAYTPPSFAGRGPIPHRDMAWEELFAASDTDLKGMYHDHPRVELVEMLAQPPRRVLDIGCATGATGLLIKQRYPSAQVIGIELHRKAAEIARGRIDLVITQLFEQTDLAAEGIAPASIDTVILADVLEHMVNPWETMLRLRPWLTGDAQILASIPNVRNLWLIEQLAQGRWRYEREGLLDVTHLRFFTLEEIRNFFGETGFEVVRTGHTLDGRVHKIQVPTSDGTFNLETDKLTIKGVSAQELAEWKTLQFLVSARPKAELPATSLPKAKGMEPNIKSSSAQNSQALSPLLPESRWLPQEKTWAELVMKGWAVAGGRVSFFALVLLAEDRHSAQATQESMAGQWLSGELLSLADGAGKDGAQFDALNHHIRDMAADWIGIVDAGDQLAPDALFRVAHALREHPEWQLVYTDEDSLTPDGQHVNPHCKPDFNIDYLRSLPYIGGLLLIKKELFAELGGFDPAADGAEDYDLILRAWEKIGDAGIGHIPEVLYHRLQGGGHCSKSVEEIIQVSQSVLQGHLQRLGIAAEVTPGPFPPSTRVRYPLHEKPLVSILIPTRNQLGYLQRCVESLIEKTQYPAYEILIIDNDSDDVEARTYLDMLAAQEEQLGGRLRVLRHPGPFNFSAMNNRAVEQARGDYLLLLNNDTAALHEDWLDEMVSHALRPGVGVVGAKLLFPDGKIQHAGVILGMRGPAEHPFIGQPPEFRGYFGRAMLTQNLSAVTGACLLISKALYQELGGLDEQRFQVSYNDIDLCLKARDAGHKIVFTPWAMLLHEGSASQRGEVEKKPSPEKEKRFADEKMAFYQKWLPQLAFDPAYNRHLSLASTDFLLEDQAALTWDPEWRPRPRILVHPADREGCGEYRIISPMRALQKAGRVQGWETMRIFEPAEMARFSPESIVLQRQMEWPQIEALERHKKLLKTFRVFEIDDLITNLPVKSLHKAQIHKDIAKRFRKAAGLCNRLVVATEPLAKAYKGFSDEVRVQPNCIEDAIWVALQPKRRGLPKPRVGWAGGVGHTGDLEMIADVVRDLADEVDWVFFGLCPDALRPYVREFHTGVPLPQYPAKLASLDLDLALAPLENNAFNEAKSHLRILEYGILGYPVIASDIFPYQGDFPVTLVANRYRDWVRAIREQIADRQALAAAGDRLREHVRAHWLLEEHLDDWLAAWLP